MLPIDPLGLLWSAILDQFSPSHIAQHLAGELILHPVEAIITDHLLPSCRIPDTSFYNTGDFGRAAGIVITVDNKATGFMYWKDVTHYDYAD